MPRRWSYTRCRRCRKPATAKRVLSARGLCRVCSDQAVRSAIVEVREGSGPAYDRWRAGIVAHAERLQAKISD